MKISRIVFSALLAGGIVVGTSAVAASAAGTSDSGYRAPGVTATLSVVSYTAGQPFTISVSSENQNLLSLNVSSLANASGQIAVGGEKSVTKSPVAGHVTFTVTLAEPGTATLVVTDAVTGRVLVTQVVSDPSGGTSGALASTGSSDARPIALGAAGLVVVGAGAVVVARRRRAQQL